jgi:hypothetical protein
MIKIFKILKVQMKCMYLLLSTHWMIMFKNQTLTQKKNTSASSSEQKSEMSKLDNNEVVNYFTEFSQLDKYQAVSGRFT